MARAHRIGQVRDVKVIRLVAQHTVEEIILQRANQKLKLTENVIEKANFTTKSDADFVPKDSKSLLDVVKFGLKEICHDDKSTIDDNDIETILNKAEAVQEHIAKSPKNPQALSRTLSRKGTLFVYEEKTPQSMYEFEGQDYKSTPTPTPDEVMDVEEQDGDAAALEALLPDEKGDESLKVRRTRTLVSPAALEQRQAEVPPFPHFLSYLKATQAKQKRKASQLARKQAKWAELGYTSTAITLDEPRQQLLDSPPLDDFSSEDDSGLHYLNGDASAPEQIPALILQTVDNSGTWGHGGFFSALDQKSDNPAGSLRP